MKKYLIALILLVLGLILFVFLFKEGLLSRQKPISSSNSNLVSLRLGYVSNSMVELPVAVAIKQGLFKKYGLDVKIVKSSNGTNNSKVFVSGGTDISISYPTAYLLAAAEGAKIKFIGVATYNNSFIFISNKEKEEIKNVGVTGKGGEVYQATLQFLKSMGINAKDVTFTTIGSQDLIGKSMLVGNIDGAVFPESVWAMFKDKNSVPDDYKIIARTPEKERKIAGIFVNSDTLDNKKDAIESFSKAILEADNWINNNSTENIIKVVTGVNGIDAESAPYLTKYGKEALKGVIFTPKLDLIEDIKKGLESDSPKMKEYDIKNFVSFDVSNALKEQGALERYGF